MLSCIYEKIGFQPNLLDIPYPDVLPVPAGSLTERLPEHRGDEIRRLLLLDGAVFAVFFRTRYEKKHPEWE